MALPIVGRKYRHYLGKTYKVLKVKDFKVQIIDDKIKSRAVTVKLDYFILPALDSKEHPTERFKLIKEVEK